MTNRDYSLEALNKFLDHAGSKGMITQNTALSRKNSANKILSVLEEDKLKDLRNVDVSDVFSRFTNLKGTEFKPESLLVYKSRLKSALDDFFRYVESPEKFKSGGARRAIKRDRAQSKPSHSELMTDRSSQSNAAAIPIFETHESQHLTIPIPLRDGLTVRIHNVPANLTAQEAEKLAAIIKAYAMSQP